MRGLRRLPCSTVIVREKPKPTRASGPAARPEAGGPRGVGARPRAGPASGRGSPQRLPLGRFGPPGWVSRARSSWGSWGHAGPPAGGAAAGSAEQPPPQIQRVSGYARALQSPLRPINRTTNITPTSDMGSGPLEGQGAGTAMPGGTSEGRGFGTPASGRGSPDHAAGQGQRTTQDCGPEEEATQNRRQRRHRGSAHTSGSAHRTCPRQRSSSTEMPRER